MVAVVVYLLWEFLQLVELIASVTSRSLTEIVARQVDGAAADVSPDHHCSLMIMMRCDDVDLSPASSFLVADRPPVVQDYVAVLVVAFSVAVLEPSYTLSGTSAHDESGVFVL